jgi:hypothetical protein
MSKRYKPVFIDYFGADVFASGVCLPADVFQSEEAQKYRFRFIAFLRANANQLDRRVEKF